jgi:hypothetical protein
LLFHKRTVPEHIRHWRRQRDEERLELWQAKCTSYGVELLEMQWARRIAFRPAKVALLCWLGSLANVWTTAYAILVFMAQNITHPAILLVMCIIAITSFLARLLPTLAAYVAARSHSISLLGYLHL